MIAWSGQLKVLHNGRRIRMLNFRWYFARLKAMSFREIFYRMDQFRRQFSERIFYRLGLEWKLSSGQSGYIDNFDLRSRVLPADLSTSAFSEGQIRNAVEGAEQILHGVVRLFGHDYRVDPAKPEWHCDPITGRRWPQVFYGDIATRDAGQVGGVKWVWELNRHHHLFILARAYFHTGETRYAEVIVSQILDWIEANPCFEGVNWTSPLEMAIRVVNWIWSLALIQPANLLGKEDGETITGSIYQHARQIERHLSGHSSANNHLIGEAAALFFVSSIFVEWPESFRWRRRGLAILEREIKLQIHPDGAPAEQAVDYLLFDMEWFLLVEAQLRRSRQGSSSVCCERLRAAGLFLSLLMDHCGHLPAIGDSDDSRVLDFYGARDNQRLYSLLAVLAVFAKDAQVRAAVERWPQGAYWLLGEEGRQSFASLEKDQEFARSKAFFQGGYAVLGNGKTQLVFDAGEIGYLSMAAHGHADALSVWLSTAGGKVLIDSGTYGYHEAGKWRDYFRGTYAHNTVVVDGRDQAVPGGTFIWSRKPDARIVSWHADDTAAFVQGVHNGYADLGIIHERSVLFRFPSTIVIRDELSGAGTHSVAQLWHLPAGSEIQVFDKTIIVHTEDAKISFFSDAPEQMKVNVMRGAVDPIQGWVSNRYGRKEPAPVISLGGSVKLPFRVHMELQLDASFPVGRDGEFQALIEMMDHFSSDKDFD